MSSFVPPTDPQAVADALRPALALLGTEAVLQALAPVVPITLGKAGRLLRRSEPHQVAVGDRILLIDGRRASLQHVVGGVVLSTENVLPKDLPSVLGRLVSAAVQEQGNDDDATVVITSLRDAVSAGS